jgi:Homeodomain-like domain-containing protein
MHGPELRHQALRLVADGLTDGAAARRLSLPRTTIRDWRRLARRPEPGRCPRCWKRVAAIGFREGDYAELLGLYLGDGYVCGAGRVHRLRLSLDAKYPGIVDDALRLLSRCFPSNSVGMATADAGSTVVLSVYSAHLVCLFPQHGPGKKHERPIVLEPWQVAELEGSPWSFIRGCIRSDGCVFVNRTGPYEYLSYDFFNLSADIRALFMHACDIVGVRYCDHAKRVRINRRPSVARMEAQVGLKE